MMNSKLLQRFSCVFYDIFAAYVATVIAFLLSRKEISIIWPNEFVSASVVWSLTTFFGMYVFKIYNTLWRFSGINEIVRIFVGCLVPMFATCITQKAIWLDVDFSLYVLLYFLTAFSILAYRFFIRHFEIKDAERTSHTPKTDISGNVMIIGAGAAGEAIIKELYSKKDVKIKCIIDDNPAMYDQYLAGIHIVGNSGTILNNVEKYKIDTIIFAIPSCPLKRRTEILNICGLTKCDLKILPSLYKLENVNEFVPTIRKVEIEDLLGRDPIKVNVDSVMNYVNDKVVLVTGGGGSIGSELCRQIATYGPKQLIILDIYENSAYEIQNELKHNFPTLDLVTLVGSVRDTKRMDYVFRTYRPEIVYHAAAHKHVPLLEDSPNESIKNNVFGTLKTAECADRYEVKRFILISTDKAVNPTNIMGASKRICEMIVQAFNEKSKTEFVAVRFGNVLGSNGSVIPLFKKQLEQGGPLTVTDPNIIRYFMTIPEAVLLVLQAGANAKGGEIYVLDMGEPVKILTLAENLIRLSGFEPYKDIGIVFTGLRPGEKLYEELLMFEEGLRATENELIHVGRPIDIDTDILMKTLKEMRIVMYDENADIRGLVKRIVPTYQIPKE